MPKKRGIHKQKTQSKKKNSPRTELYDDLGQKLSAARFNVAALRDLGKNKTVKENEALNSALNLLSESIEEIRHISSATLQDILMENGLVAAITELCRRVSSPTLQINFESVKLSRRLDRTIESVLFLITQEIINNVITHSEANHAIIQIVKHKNEVTLLLEDNGKGFAASRSNFGKGLRKIESNVALLNGEAVIDSFPGKGTTISIEIPLS